MKKIFKEAHKMTREMVEKYGVDYKAQFSLCLSYLLEERGMEMVELKGTEKQIKWAEDIRDNMIKGLRELKTAEEHMRYHAGRDITIDEIENTIEYLKGINSSRFYIDNRFEEGTEIVILIENIKKAEETLEKIKNLELAKLEGSNKQINWANKIRDEKLKRLAEIEDWRWNEYYYDYSKEEIIKVIAIKIKSAKTFIDTRDSLDDLVKEAIEMNK